MGLWPPQPALPGPLLCWAEVPSSRRGTVSWEPLWTHWQGPRWQELLAQHGPGLPSALVCSELPRPTCQLGRVRTR